MKAIKYLGLYIFTCFIFDSCKPKEQTKHSLHPITKEYFDVKNESKYYFTEKSDTNITIVYTSKNYINHQSNPDIENSEIMVYELDAGSGQPKFTIRCESGGSEFKDRIAMLTDINGNITIGAVIFNQGGNFSTTNGSNDSIYFHSSYTINNQLFNDVLRVKLSNSNLIYSELYFAKNIGLICRKEKQGDKVYYVKRYKINK